MSILLVARNRDMKPFRDALIKKDPNLDVEIWPDVYHPERVQFAVAWNQPKEIFRQYPNLKAISSLGAGVDHLLRDASIPEEVMLTRVVVPSLAGQMGDYVLTAALNILRQTAQYAMQQQQGEWKPLPVIPKQSLAAGVMGLGEIGEYVARRLADNGFHVNGWARSPKKIDGVVTYQGGQLASFLKETQLLVCLLPLTPETEEILDLDLFKTLRKPAFLVHAGRGEHLVEEDLIYALDTGLIDHAVLDVFPEEPLPGSHPFWGRKKITITPHVASVTNPDDVAAVLLESYKRLLSGMDLMHVVDRTRGY